MEKKVQKEKIENEIIENKIINLLHLANKARKISFGYDSCDRACKNNRAKLILFAKNASDNTSKKIINLGKNTNVKAIPVLTKEKMGSSFKRRDLSMLTIDDANFANGIIKLVVN